MHPAIIIGTVRSLWTWLWGRYHVPQNVFLVIYIFGVFLFLHRNALRWLRQLSVPNQEKYCGTKNLQNLQIFFYKFCAASAYRSFIVSTTANAAHVAREEFDVPSYRLVQLSYKERVVDLCACLYFVLTYGPTSVFPLTKLGI